MKKTLISLGLAIALVIPSGVAVAAAQDDVSDTTPATVLVADQDRDQVRDCSLHDGDMLQVRDRDRIHDPALFDGDGPQAKERAREHAPADFNGEAGEQYARRGNGTAGVGLGDGTCPANAGDGTCPVNGTNANGTENGFGRSGR